MKVLSVSFTAIAKVSRWKCSNGCSYLQPCLRGAWRPWDIDLRLPTRGVQMAGRTFAIGDIHGDIAPLHRVLGRLPPLQADDTVVFLGDYLDRGPRSKDVVEQLMSFPGRTPAKVVCLRGNHEDAWLRVCREGWD